MNGQMINAYLNRENDVHSWFGGAWNSLEGLELWADEISGTQSSHWKRPQLTGILSQAATSYGSSAATHAQIKLLREDNCYAIITGQQPAVGGGPLYTLIKAAQAIATAQQLRARGRHAVPIFWCASEDHDHGEANHADFIAHNGQVHRYSCSFENTGASSHFQMASAWWDEFLSSCQEFCGPGIGADFIQSLKPDNDENMGHWQCRLLSGVFAEQGLICLEAHLLRPLWHPMLAEIVDHWPRLALAQQRSVVMERGYSDSFNGPLNHPPLFLDLAEGRSSISDNDARTLHSWSHNLHVEDNRLGSASMSSGAALRPILQQLCLPGMAYVGGPGELHYHAFLGPLYDEFQAPRPRFIPRFSCTLMPTWLQRQIQQWQLKPEDITLGSHAPVLDGTHSHAEESINAIFDLLQGEEFFLNQYDDNFSKRMRTGLKDIHHSTEKLSQSLQRHQRNQMNLPPYGHIHDFMHPRGKPQERVMSMSQAIWLYGQGIGTVLVNHCEKAKLGQHAHILL